MATNLTNLAIISLLALALTLLAADCTIAGQQQQQQKQDDLKKPQTLLELGPLKFGFAYKENKYNDRLKLNKIVMNYYLNNGQDQFHKHLFKVVHRDELVRCQNFLPQAPEMESLIDCKSLEEQTVPNNQVQMTTTTTNSGDATSNYVKRTTLAAKVKLNFSPFFSVGESRHLAQFYPFKTDFTEQSILRVLKQHDMEQGLGFGPSPLTVGYLVELKSGGSSSKSTQDSFPYQCTANLFISINRTRHIPAQTPGDDFPETLHAYEHYLDEIRQSGGFVSVQEASCSTPLVPLSIETDFTLIYRKQFPYVTCSHHVGTSPIPNLWNYTGTVQQKKGIVGSTSDEAYETTVNINSASIGFKNLNFVLSQNFTNQNFSTGFEQMVLAHPFLTALVHGEWSENSLEKIFSAYSTDSTGAVKAGPDDPNLKLIFTDTPDTPLVSFRLSLNRKIFYNLLSAQNFAFKEEEEQQPDEELNFDTLAAVFNAITPEFRSQIEGVVQQVLRDEL